MKKYEQDEAHPVNKQKKSHNNSLISQDSPKSMSNSFLQVVSLFTE